MVSTDTNSIQDVVGLRSIVRMAVGDGLCSVDPIEATAKIQLSSSSRNSE